MCIFQYMTIHFITNSALVSFFVSKYYTRFLYLIEDEDEDDFYDTPDVSATVSVLVVAGI